MFLTLGGHLPGSARESGRPPSPVERHATGGLECACESVDNQREQLTAFAWTTFGQASSTNWARSSPTFSWPRGGPNQSRNTVRAKPRNQIELVPWFSSLTTKPIYGSSP